MLFPSGIGRLPVEILSMIMDFLDIQQLLTISHVSGAFNTVARSRPLFWRDINLAAVSDSALEFFQARISREPERRVHIIVRLQDHPSCDGITSIVLPTIQRNLSRVTQLSIHLHSNLADAAISALDQSASFLETLVLRFAHCSEDRPPAVLPSQLFAGQCCSHLTYLSLSNVAVPANSIPAFQKAHFVGFHFNIPRGIPFYWLFEHLPELHTLCIISYPCIGVDHPAGAAVATPPASLCQLQLWLSPPAYDNIFHSVRNLASVKRIVCRLPHDVVTQQLISHLRGSLELHFLSIIDHRMVHVRLYDLETEHVRTLAVHTEDLPEELTRDVLFAPQLLERIVTLRLSVRLVYLVPHLPEIPHCHTFEIILETQSSVPNLEISAPLRLPELRAVCVGNREPAFIEVPAEQLRRFLSELLDVRSSGPTLQLLGVSVTGDRDALFNDFKEINI